jgi:hypothetical protein
MIKLTVDPKVLAAMKKAFPKAMSAERALKKYIGVLENMLTKSLQFQRSPIQSKQAGCGLSYLRLRPSPPLLPLPPRVTRTWLPR